MRSPASSRHGWISGALRRLGLALVLISIFAVSFGGTFTCETNQNNSTNPRPDPPPR